MRNTTPTNPLQSLADGPVPDDRILAVEEYLAAIWPTLAGGQDYGMAFYKIKRRTEDLYLENGIITFEIERHGAAALGSIYAEVQTWAVDVGAATATMWASRRRQIRPAQRRWDAQTAAEEVVRLILDRVADDRIKFLDGGGVRIMISTVTPPGAPKQTEEGRRRRFSVAVRELMEAQGWTPSGRAHYWYPPG